MQHMHVMIHQLFDCWADPVAHLLKLKSSMASMIKERRIILVGPI